jgi:hypothetical protein
MNKKTKFLYAKNGSGCYPVTKEEGRKIKRMYPGLFTWKREKVRTVKNIHYDEAS